MRAVRYHLLNHQAVMLSFSCPRDEWNKDMPRTRQGYCAFCRSARKKNLADRLFSEHDYKFAKGIKELTLNGCSPARRMPGRFLGIHPFMQSNGFKAICPETLEVKSQWCNWDLKILRDMSMKNLKVLKVPLHLTKDCARLGKAITNMPRLMSLAINMPNREEVLTGLKFLGKGIMFVHQPCANWISR